MTALTLSLFLAAGLHVQPAPTDSPATAPEQVRAIRLPQPIAIDGLLTDAAWRTAVRIERFIQRDPNEGAAATESTVVFVAYDDAAIYVGARLYDSHPDSILALLGRRDAGVHADRFVFFVDPYHDRRSGFFFGLNAAGTLMDGVLFNDDWDDDSWDGVWDGRVTADSLGWTAEMRIPYSQIRFNRAEVYTWGVNFGRFIARKNESDYYAPRPKNASGFVSRFADLVGIERITPPARLEVMPYLTSKAEFGPHAAGDPFNDGSRLTSGLGADARIGLGPNLTLNATVNPDFGQVEVDPAVVNLSDAETFFNEKRPFFVEGSSTFNFGFGGQRNFWGFNWAGPDFFYSRRIGRSLSANAPAGGYVDSPTGAHILGALKLTGKAAGTWNVGALSAVTAKEEAQIDSAGRRWSQEIEPLAFYGVYRAQKEFAEGRQGLGFLSTVAARRFDDSALRDVRNASSLAFGADGWTFLDHDKRWVTTGWLGLSRIAGSAARILTVQQNSIHYFQQPDAEHATVDSAATSLTGMAGRFTLAKQKGNSFVNSAVGFLSPGFDVNDLGFMFRTGLVNMHVGGGYSWTEPGKVFRRAELGGAVFRNYDWDGNINWSGVFHFGFVQFLNYYHLNWNVAHNPWTVNNRRTRGGPLTLTPPGYQFNFNVGSDSRKPLTFGVFTGTYYRSAADASWWLGTELQYRPAPNVSVSVEPSVNVSQTPTQYVEAYDDPAATATFDRRYVFAALDQTELSAGIRMNWTFTPKLSLQLYAQPLISAGDYGRFRALARPRTYDFDVWNDGTSSFDSTSYSPPDLDFNFKSLRGNAVLRWEYLPGSTLFFVWTQGREDFEPSGDFRVGPSLDRLLRAPARNIFLIKATYWWNP
ncbi:MAG: carbohydrate binding family 9 domain-containing protein [Gemmatimonadetes bacterium]|nr:carbohydrate binding family 9 domain-containing protein [Gemmatimonadota bacterium]